LQKCDFDLAEGPEPTIAWRNDGYFISAHSVGDDPGPWSFDTDFSKWHDKVKNGEEYWDRLRIGIGIAFNPKQEDQRNGDGTHKYIWNHISCRFPEQKISVVSGEGKDSVFRASTADWNNCGPLVTHSDVTLANELMVSV